MMTATARFGEETLDKQGQEGQEEGSWTILKLMRWCQKFFATKGLDQPRLDTEVLLGHTLGMSRVQLYTHFDRPLSDEELGRFKATIKRRVAREPVAYIVGHKEFWSLEFKVDGRVLIPRPDTELLVQMAREQARRLVDDPSARPPQDELPEDLEAQRRREMTAMPSVAEATEGEGAEEPEDLEAQRRREMTAMPESFEDAEDADSAAEEPEEATGWAQLGPSEGELPDWEPSRPVRVLDVGTGSGAIAVALALELPYARVTATDISAGALEVARGNAARLAGEAGIVFREGDLMEAVRDEPAFDVIVSNPPYIAEADLEQLMPDVGLHEPRLALAGGDDGLGVLRRLAEDAWGRLRPGGVLLCEIGFDQEQSAPEVFEASGHGWTGVKVTRDPLTQHHRVVEAHRPS